ncbi:MAG: CPBP family intramembrane metalloprotease [Bacteroidetes bacterium]|nr:CPBP family intramembrane metalloprotease [Bacteroidota bacterium]
MQIETKDKVYFPNLLHSIGLVILLFVIEFPFSLLRKITELNNPELKSSFIHLISSVLEMTVIIIVALMIMRKRNKDNYKLKFKRVSFLNLSILAIMGMSVLIITKALTIYIPITHKTAEYYHKLYEPNFLNLVRAVIIVPITEEIFFRGIILQGLLKNYKPTVAIFLSAIIFGLVHMNPGAMITATVGGLLTGWIYWKTNSLLPCIMLHFLNNMMAYLSWSKFLKLHENPSLMLFMMTVATLILIICYKYLNNNLTTRFT